jgi:hypothetical protein
LVIIFIIVFIVFSGVRLESTWYRGYYWPLPQMIDDGDCGAFGGMQLAGETEVLGENLPQCHLSTTSLT